MHPVKPITLLLGHFWEHIEPQRRTQFGALLILMILTSFAEVLSIGAVLPFLGVLTAPGPVFLHPAAQSVIRVLGVTEPSQLLLPITVAFGVAVLVAGGMRLLLLWTTTRLSFKTAADLSSAIYQRTLYQPYSVHIARNSSEVIDGIWVKVWGVVYGVILPALTLISACIMLIMILGAFLAVFPLITMVAIGGFGLIYVIIITLSQKRLLSNSRRIAAASTEVIKSLQEGLGGIRDVLIDGSQTIHLRIYRDADQPLRQAQGNNYFMTLSPRYGVEALGMLLIAMLAYVLTQQLDGVAKAIPVLGALALGAQRLLPVLQQGYEGWTQIRGAQATLQDTLALLDQPLPDYLNHPMEQIAFVEQIDLKHVSFRYGPQTPWVLRDVSFSIAKGSQVGFTGTTGSGKSTLLDIVMGLLQPSEGTLEIDNHLVTEGNHRAWQAHIAHVPQAIFLADSAIEENIAFGVPKDKIDRERVRKAAQKAQIADAIETWPKKYQTVVGERGVRLSGGQRQRIGIARALYKQADVIIFDEATSALDNTTEQAVMQAIEGLRGEITILIIAHRLSTLRNCTKIVELEDGRVKRIGAYTASM